MEFEFWVSFSYQVGEATFVFCEGLEKADICTLHLSERTCPSSL